MQLKNLRVRLQFRSDSAIEVGIISANHRESLFQFNKNFLANPLPISPFRLPLIPAIQVYDRKGKMETFGLFEDSLPDGWGRKMIDTYFFKIYNRLPTILERLACVGEDSSGALCYFPEYEFIESSQPFDLAKLAKNAWDFDEGNAEDLLPELRKAVGSSGGARPKILAGLNEATGEIVANSLKLPEGFTHWIIKFNTRQEGVASGPLEYAYNEIAKRAGANVPEFRLIKTKVRHFFAAKRFDRSPDGSRLHMHSAAGLLHSNFRIAGEEYETLFKLTEALTRNYQSKLELFRRTALNVLAHNRDDHLKNFAFLMDETGKWSLSPLYDFTYNKGPNGWHTLSVAGEGKDPGLPDLLHLAKNVELDPADANSILEQVQDALSELPALKKDLGCLTKF